MIQQRKKFLKQLQAGLNDFPKALALKEKRALTHKKFAEETFGDLARQVAKQRRKKRASGS